MEVLRTLCKWSKPVTHTQTNAVWFHLYEVLTVVKFIKTESRKVVVRVGAEENEIFLKWYSILFLQDEKICGDDGDGSFTTYKCI